IKDIRELFTFYNIVDLAYLVSDLDINEAIFVFKILDMETSGDLFSYLDADHQEKLINHLTGDEISEIIDNLYSDDIVDFMSEMPNNIVEKVLQSVSLQQRKDLNILLSYKENSAGSIMSIDFFKLKDTFTIGDGLAYLKKQGHLAETISYGYIVDKKDILVGIIDIKDILFENDDALLVDVMDKEFVYAYTNDDQEQVAKIISKYDITTLPIIDEGHHMVGIVTIDDIIDVMVEEASEDIHKMAAVAPIDGSYVEASSFELFKSRIGWLLILMVSSTMSGLVILQNTDVVSLLPSIVTFFPMLMDTSGNAGSQACVMVIRGIIVDDLTIHDFFKVLWKEFRVSLICGSILFIVNFARIVIFTSYSYDMALVVSITVFLAVLLSKLIGGVLPLVAIVFKIDPASMSTPIITTSVDMMSLGLFFMLVRVMLL
ncbi:MAG: magnesium transporter, partial [Erysipelotrichaceae bacterium]